MPRAGHSPARRRWQLVAVVLVAAVGAAAWLMRPHVNVQGSSSVSAQSVPAGSTAPTAPTTARGSGTWSDARATNTVPVVTEPPNDIATDAPKPAQAGVASVVVTRAEWDTSGASVRVNGYVGGVIEEGGTCTLTLSQGTETRTATSTARADATTTICSRMTVQGNQLASGTWRAVISYSSASTTATSNPTEVTVP